MVEREDLVVPVYLNQRIVFDLVAMLQGGIAAVTQITQTQSDSSSISGEVSSTFGLSQALSSLLRVDFSGKAGGSTAAEMGEMRSEQRIHTPASLFIALRALLREKDFIVTDATDRAFQPGDIVEFSAILQRNPLLESIGSFIELVDMMQAFTQGEPKQKGTKSSELNKMKRQMETFVSALQGSDTLDLTTESLASSHRAVITLEQQYLNDPTMADLVDGTFRVVGKVTRVVGPEDEPISLNRKSAMGKLPPSVMEQMKQAFEGPDFSGFAFRSLEWEIDGPAIQVIPIAIFA